MVKFLVCSLSLKISHRILGRWNIMKEKKPSYLSDSFIRTVDLWHHGGHSHKTSFIKSFCTEFFFFKPTKRMYFPYTTLLCELSSENCFIAVFAQLIIIIIIIIR